MPEVNSLDITTSYSGEGAFPYVSAGILSANTLATGLVTTMENVKKSIALQKVASGAIQAFNCDFDAVDNDITITEAVLTPTKMMRNIQLCKADFRESWMASRTGKGFANDMVPAEFQSYLLLNLAENVSAGVEKAIWRGDYNSASGATTGGDSVSTFGGLLALAVVGTASLGYDGTVAGAFTADANATTGILTHLDAITDNAPDAIQGDSEALIYMSRKSLAQLQRAMAGFATFQANGVDTTGYAGAGIAPQFVGEARPTQYVGYQIVVPNGFPNDTILMGKSSNLFFGTDMHSDFNSATVVDMTKSDASDNVRVRMQFTGGCQIAFLGDLAVVRRTS